MPGNERRPDLAMIGAADDELFAESSLTERVRSVRLRARLVVDLLGLAEESATARLRAVAEDARPGCEIVLQVPASATLPVAVLLPGGLGAPPYPLARAAPHTPSEHPAAPDSYPDSDREPPGKGLSSEGQGTAHELSAVAAMLPICRR